MASFPTAFQANAFQFSAFQIGDHADAGGDFGESLKKKRRKSSHQRAQTAIDQAISKAVSDKQFRKGAKQPDIWHAEPLPDIAPLPIPSFDPRMVALADPLAAIRADLARLNEQKRREEDDIELLLMSI